MNRKINIFFLLFILSGCINNSNSSNMSNSSSFKGYDDISLTIVDPGSYDKVNQFIVEGKVISIDGTKVKPFNTDMTLTSYSELTYNSLSPIYDYHIKELQVPIYKDGKLVYDRPNIEEIRAYCKQEVDSFWDEVKRLVNPHKYYVDLSQELWDLKDSLLKEYSKK